MDLRHSVRPVVFIDCIKVAGERRRLLVGNSRLSCAHHPSRHQLRAAFKVGRNSPGSIFLPAAGWDNLYDPQRRPGT
jgi:hypothetical protein